MLGTSPGLFPNGKRSHIQAGIARAGDADPGSLERRRREIALPLYRIIF